MSREPTPSSALEIIVGMVGGEQVGSGANSPYLLADPDELLIVEQGEIDVFLVPLRDGAVVGNRRYLWSTRTGNALLGVAPQKATLDGSGGEVEIGLLAVGTEGALLRRASLATLLQAIPDSGPEGMAAVTGVIDGYVRDLAGALGAQTRQQVAVALRAGEAPALSAGDSAGPLDDVVWVRHRQGSSSYLGSSELVVDARDACLPLAPGSFLHVLDNDTSLAVFDSASCISRDEALAGLTLLRALFMAFAASSSAQLHKEEIERLRRKTRVEHAMEERGRAALTSVLTGTLPVLSVEGAESPLFAACRAIGAAGDITFRMPPAWETATRVRDELGAICRASRVRYRRVGLRDEWWRTDSGPLLGFISAQDTDGSEKPVSGAESAQTAGAAQRATGEEKHVPVALIPSGRGRYFYVDPESGTQRKVDARFSATLEPFAYTFYRPLPDKPLGGAALLRLVFEGMRGDVLTVMAMALASGLLALALPLATGKMFSVVIPGALTDEVTILFLALVAANLGSAAFDLTRAFALVRIEGSSTATLQAAVIDRLLALPVPFFRGYSTGDLTQRALGINTARSMLSGAAMSSLLAGVFSLTNLALMFYYDVRLALVAVAMLAAVSAVTVALTVPALRAERRRVETQGRIAGLVFQMVTGIAKLRIAAAEGRGFSVWATQFRDQKRQAYRARSFQNAVTVLNDTVPLIATLALFATAVWLMSRGSAFNTGQFIAFNAAFGIFFSSGVMLSNTLVNLLNVRPVLERARPILRAVPEVDASKPEPGELTGAIEVSHVKFRYTADGPLILDDISFTARPGEFIAFVGPSGSGKSTTLRLLLGFEKPESGAVYYDGQDLDGLNHAAVRSQIGVVLQSSRILAGDIFTNLVGSSPLTIDDAWEAAEAAGIADDIREMPMGMHTVISEGGSTISGGQRQRLLIARALIRKPRIIFFDEATSALDNRTQKQVSTSLDQLHTTRIVIAHRLSTIRNADRIFVIDKGRVVQSGNFEKLVKKPGLFAELVKRQMA